MATKHQNMGHTDRALRAFVIAPIAILIALALGASSIVGIALFAVAGIALVTSATGFCPAYVPLGIDTRGRKALSH